LRRLTAPLDPNQNLSHRTSMSSNPANLFIHGEWKSALDGGTREIVNPANNKVIATVSDGSPRDAELAIAAARKAFDDGPWPRMRAVERAGYLFKLADAIEARAEEF